MTRMAGWPIMTEAMQQSCLTISLCHAGLVGSRVPLCRLQGLPGQHEEPGGLLPGDAGHGDEERGLLCGAWSQLHVSAS